MIAKTSIALALVLAVPLVAQESSNRVILKIGQGPSALGDPDNGKVTLTLASGTKITVPLSDLDIPMMRQLSGQPGGAPEPLVSPSQAQAIYTTKCQKDWPADFRMQSYCLDQQREAVTALQRRTMASPEQQTIRGKCAKDWPADFRMRDYCETQQLEALAKLRR